MSLMSYSLDYRHRVFEIKEKEELTFEETSKRFGVSMRTLFNWKKRIKPKLRRSKPATKVDMEALEKDVAENPDKYQYERAQDLGVSQSAIFYALQRLNVSHKKNATSPKSRRGKKS